MKEILHQLVNGNNLTTSQTEEAMNLIMSGEATQAQIGAFLISLKIKGETIEEITGCAKVMREKAERINPNVEYYIDTCGTGGDSSNIFNVSTAAALITAAAGVTVAKHGNRSLSSKCGCADVLEELGINIQLSPIDVEKCIEDTGFGFMFAPSFHKSMKYAAGPRKEIGVRTIFNALGPLTNPANAKGQLMGVFDKKLVLPICNVLANLGLERALVIYGLDGLDEISNADKTFVAELKDGKVSSYEISPEDFGISRSKREDVLGGESKENADILMAIFKGEKGPKRDMVVLNAGAALFVGKKASSIKEGIRLAEEVIDSGKVLEKLNRIKEFTNKV